MSYSKSLHAFLLLASIHNTQVSSFHVPASPPSNASDVVNPSFMGFGIECTSFPQYTGNNFSLNMFSAFTKRSSAPLLLRLGGTSQDNSVWMPNQTEAVYYPDGDKGLSSLLYLGQDWLSGLTKVLGAKFELELPLARENMTNGIEFLKANINAMGISNLYSIELGNEPNAYPGEKRAKNYTVADYVQDFLDYESAIDKEVPSLSQPIYRGLDYASGDNLTEWTAPAAFSDGIDSNKQLKEVSMHYYAVRESTSLSATNLNQTYIEHTLSRFQAQIASAKAHDLPFILGEVGDEIGQGNESDPTFGRSLASAVWAANWMLYCMTFGVDRVQMQLLHGAEFSAWQPVTNESRKEVAGVSGTFYGEIMIADLIGSAGKGLRVAQLKSGLQDVPAYAAYNGQALSRVMLFNNHLWTGEGDRPSKNISLTLPVGTKQVTVERLSGTTGIELKNISWAGQTWEYPSGLPMDVKNDTDVLKVAGDGTVVVNMPATEGAMVILS